MNKKKSETSSPPSSESESGSKEAAPNGSSEMGRSETDRSSPPNPQLTKTTQLSRYVSFGLLLAVIGLVAFVFYEVMVSFLVPLFLAALLVVVFRPLHAWFMEKCKGRKSLSAGLTTGVVCLTVLIPVVLLLFMALLEGRQVIKHFNPSQVELGVRKFRTSMGLEMPAPNQIREIEIQLSELQQTETLDEQTVDAHRSRLYDIEQAAKDVAVATDNVWPEDLPDEIPDFLPDDATATDEATDPDVSDEPAEQEMDDELEVSVPESSWVQFCRTLQQTRQHHFAASLVRSGDETEADSRKRLDAVAEYRRLINETARHFADFKAELLGGKTRAWLAELVNPSEEEFEYYTSTSVRYLRDKLLSLGGGAASFLGSTAMGFAIMIIGLYFFLKDGPGMIESFKGLSPMDDAHEQELVEEFGRVSRAVVIATLLSALVQGLLAGIGFYFVGLESVILLTVLSAVLAMVPFVGAAAVWVPCCFYLYFFENNLTAAIGLAVYGACVISMADNVIKPFVLHGQSNLHPLLALLSVLGGVATLGPIGILVGPMIVAFLQTLLKILQQEMTTIENSAN